MTTSDTSYISSTIIDGNHNGMPAVRFVSGETLSAKLIGFTIQNGSATSSGTDDGGGIYCGYPSLGSPTLSNLKILNNFGSIKFKI